MARYRALLEVRSTAELEMRPVASNGALLTDAKQLKYLLGRGIESPSDVG